MARCYVVRATIKKPVTVLVQARSPMEATAKATSGQGINLQSSAVSLVDTTCKEIHDERLIEWARELLRATPTGKPTNKVKHAMPRRGAVKKGGGDR